MHKPILLGRLIRIHKGVGAEDPPKSVDIQLKDGQFIQTSPINYIVDEDVEVEGESLGDMQEEIKSLEEKVNDLNADKNTGQNAVRLLLPEDLNDLKVAQLAAACAALEVETSDGRKDTLIAALQSATSS